MVLSRWQKVVLRLDTNDTANIISSLGSISPWDVRSNFWPLKDALQNFNNDMPRSFRLTKANSQAHLAQHTSPPFTLLHTAYSVCQIVLLRDFLPFAPIFYLSPSDLDENEFQVSATHTQGWYGNTIRDLFKTAHDFLELVQICRTRRLLPTTPIMGFAIYLVSMVGIYAIHFPQMDSEGLVCGKDQEPNVIFERQVATVEALQILSTIRALLPLAEHWFRTLHRLHKYYRQLVNEYKINPQSIPRPSSASSRNFPGPNRNLALTEPNSKERMDAIRCLDGLFKDLGTTEDENIAFSISRDGDPVKFPTGYREPTPLPQPPADTWNAVNNVSRSDPYYGNSTQQPYSQPYGNRSQPSPPKSNNSPAYDGNHSSPYPPPPNTLPPIATNSNPLTTYPPTPSSAASKHITSIATLTFSGEDVANFVDAKSDDEIATIQASWDLIKEELDISAAISPGELGKEGKKRHAGLGWLGILWQWSS
jgi:hypothetical protein